MFYYLGSTEVADRLDIGMAVRAFPGCLENALVMICDRLVAFVGETVRVQCPVACPAFPVRDVPAGVLGLVVQVGVSTGVHTGYVNVVS